MTAGSARRRSLVRPARYCAARHGTARHGTARAGMPRRTAPHHGMPTLGTLRRHATTGPGSAPAPLTTPAVAAGALPNITPSPALTVTALPINTPTALPINTPPTSAVEGRGKWRDGCGRRGGGCEHNAQTNVRCRWWCCDGGGWAAWANEPRADWYGRRARGALVACPSSEKG